MVKKKGQIYNILPEECYWNHQQEWLVYCPISLQGSVPLIKENESTNQPIQY